jgi:uncharacterized protein YndB with AHSA1/START domain
MEITRSIVIERPIREVFDFVADSRNDPRWCPKVDSVEPLTGDDIGPGARHSVVHRPVPFRPARVMDHHCVSWSPPELIEWREDDSSDSFEVTYLLEEEGGGTRLTQTSEARLGAPRLLHPVFRAGIGRDISVQLKSLKQILESSAVSSGPGADPHPVP